MKSLRNLFCLIVGIVLYIPIMAEDVVGHYNNDGYYVATLPWGETFDNLTGNYDGTSMLPNGWMASGNAPFVTAASASMEARTGKYYMVTDPYAGARNDRAYTPFFQLEANKNYTFTFWLWMPGQKNYGTTNNLILTVGREQDYELQTTKLLEVNTQLTQWTQYSVTYTPTDAGLYTFCFHLLTEAPLSGCVGIEDVGLREDHQALPPTADFAVDGNMSLINDDYVVFPTSKIHLVNHSSEATEYLWSIPGATPSTSTEKDVAITFNESGTYEITLSARNSSGEHSYSKSINVGVYSEADPMMAIQNFNGTLDKTYARSEVPTFSTNPETDFITGPNHYYYTIAERYEIPEIQEIDITRLSYFLTNFSMLTSTSSTTWPVQKNVPVTVKLVGETNGLPDETKTFGSLTGPLSEMVADRGIGVGQMKEFAFPNPVRVKGTFYVVLSFDQTFLIDSPDAQIGGSYFGMSACKHHSGTTTMYVKPHHDLNGAPVENTWYIGNDFHPDLNGFGMLYYVWGQSLAPDLRGVDNIVITPDSIVLHDMQGRPQTIPASRNLYIKNHKVILSK